MSAIAYSRPRLDLRFSATNTLPLLFGAFYLATFISVPIFAEKVGSPVPVDKVGALLLAPLALLGSIRALKAKRGILMFVAGYFCLGAISSVVHLAARNHGTYPLWAPMLGILLDSKPFVFMLASYELLARRTCDEERAIGLVLRVVLGVSLLNGISVLHDLVLGGRSVWGIPLGTGPLGLPLAAGLFNHKYPSACASMFGAIAALSLMRERFSVLRLLAFACLFALLIFNGSVKELVALVFTGILFIALPSRHSSIATLGKKIIVATLMSVVGIGALSYISQIISRRYRDYGVEVSVRVAMHAAALAIAKDNFPFGSGAGTFASSPSRDVAYSPLYYKYGIFVLYGGGPGQGQGNYLLDAWWPHILAESGFIGTFFYIAILAYALRHLKRAQKVRRNAGSFFLFAAGVALVMNSAAAPTFTMDVLQPLIGLVLGASMLRARDHALDESLHRRDDLFARPLPCV